MGRRSRASATRLDRRRRARSLDGDDDPSAGRHDPRCPGLVPVQGPQRAGDLCGQGVEPAPAVVELLRRPPVAAPAHGPDDGGGGIGRVDDRAQRGRGADARVLPHQGARPALQRPPPRRQELPLPRRHRRRAVPAGTGDARSQAQGHPLLRAVRPRLRHPQHPRRAGALVPDPHVQPVEVPATPTPRPAVPALPHREVLGAVRRRDRGDAVPPAGRRAVRVPRRRHRRRSSSTSTRTSARRPPRWSSRRRPAYATAWPTSDGRSSASRWWPTPTTSST